MNKYVKFISIVQLLNEKDLAKTTTTTTTKLSKRHDKYYGKHTLTVID